jgi:hypothetical protein
MARRKPGLALSRHDWCITEHVVGSKQTGELHSLMQEAVEVVPGQFPQNRRKIAFILETLIQ